MTTRKRKKLSKTSFAVLCNLLQYEKNDERQKTFHP